MGVVARICFVFSFVMIFGQGLAQLGYLDTSCTVVGNDYAGLCKNPQSSGHDYPTSEYTSLSSLSSSFLYCPLLLLLFLFIVCLFVCSLFIMNSEWISQNLNRTHSFLHTKNNNQNMESFYFHLLFIVYFHFFFIFLFCYVFEERKI